MRIAALKTNDIVDSDDGFAVSLWTAGCPHHCPGCHNSQYWGLDTGEECTDLDGLTTRILRAIHRNGMERCFSILGGEPMAPWNREGVAYLINRIKSKCPTIKIYLWSGYTIEELREAGDENIDLALSQVDYLIEGRFVQELRDITLKLRGSSNQRIYRRNSDGVLEDVTPPLVKEKIKKEKAKYA